jgi:predicted  nucleic acid-binding Zn-ribbon protein
MRNTLYERDFFAWANEQAALLRAGRLSEADVENIAEEIESMGRSEKRELTSRLKVLLTHLLKWQCQPGLRSKSWRNTIEGQREDVAEHLADNPSLTDKLPTEFVSAYRKAIRAAAEETGFDRRIFPPVCPWTYEQVMDNDFWPAETSGETMA